MATLERRVIHDPFLAQHRVVGATIALLGLIAVGALLGLVVGSVVAQVIDLVLAVVAG